MFTTVLLVLAALGLFWAVGAYNRLVRLSNAVLSAYGPVDQHLRVRQALLEQALTAAAGFESFSSDERTALSLALQQMQGCIEALGRKRLDAAELGRLAQAEQTLKQCLTQWLQAAQARQHQAADLWTDLDHALSELDRQAALAAVPYQMAQRAYNEAVDEFPALLIARLARLSLLPELALERLGPAASDDRPAGANRGSTLRI